jgi:hypothetical protein
MSFPLMAGLLGINGLPLIAPPIWITLATSWSVSVLMYARSV